MYIAETHVQSTLQKCTLLLCKDHTPKSTRQKPTYGLPAANSYSKFSTLHKLKYAAKFALQKTTLQNLHWGCGTSNYAVGWAGIRTNFNPTLYSTARQL
jgi:hypothetical protein